MVGENGAGKSTLMNLIGGVHQADAGRDPAGRQAGAHYRDPNDALRMGIGFVHQEITLCQHMSVAENIFMHALNGLEGKPLRRVPRDIHATDAEAADRFRFPLAPINPRQNV